MSVPAELHLTTFPFESHALSGFEDFCFENESKPLIIELERGESTIQPMLTKIIHADRLQEAIEYGKVLVGKMQQANFGVSRLKIEIPYSEYEHPLFISLDKEFSPYFEWHGKVEVTKERKARLLELCELHLVHLSINSLKKNKGQRFVTLREYGSSDQFANRVELLTEDLHQNAWEIFKPHYEYCVYDSNESLDVGWLSVIDS